MGRTIWDHNVEGDAVEGPVFCVGREERCQALNDMKKGKAPGPSEVSLEFIAASGGEYMSKYITILDGF